VSCLNVSWAQRCLNVSWAVSGFAQCIGCAAQPHRATAVAITVRNDRMTLPSQCALMVPRPASDRRTPAWCGWWVSMLGWEQFLALSWQPQQSRFRSCHPNCHPIIRNWVATAETGRDGRTGKLNQINPRWDHWGCLGTGATLS
jgi:hypothetical protein